MDSLLSLLSLLSLQEFRERAACMNAEAEAHPALHRLRTAGMAMPACRYLFGIVVVLLGLTLAVVAAALRFHAVVPVKPGLPLLALDWIVPRSTWVRLEPPGGRVLRREELPGAVKTSSACVARSACPACTARSC